MDNDGHVNLTDFGLSKATKPGDGTAKTFCGTPEYLGERLLVLFAAITVYLTQRLATA